MNAVQRCDIHNGEEFARWLFSAIGGERPHFELARAQRAAFERGEASEHDYANAAMVGGMRFGAAAESFRRALLAIDPEAQVAT